MSRATESSINERIFPRCSSLMGFVPVSVIGATNVRQWRGLCVCYLRSYLVRWYLVLASSSISRRKGTSATRAREQQADGTPGPWACANWGRLGRGYWTEPIKWLWWDWQQGAPQLPMILTLPFPNPCFCDRQTDRHTHTHNWQSSKLTEHQVHEQVLIEEDLARAAGQSWLNSCSRTGNKVLHSCQWP